MADTVAPPGHDHGAIDGGTRDDCHWHDPPQSCLQRFSQGAMMAAQGYYNHYDDPDEFWDDAPLEVSRRPSAEIPVSRNVGASIGEAPESDVRSVHAQPPSQPRVPNDDVAAQQEQFERQRDIARGRIDAVMASVGSMLFTGASSDRAAVASVSSSGDVVDIRLARGFGDLTRPSWVVADDVNSVATAIVEAVNAARFSRAETVADRLAGEFAR
ncbi:YbaB/EbfC family nucleoid-associated protein [Nocardia vulneris]|uniref:YbaB/EbfC family nucleoid-associated protein n=1 Tax=Nocardia vulneris TaxID=1141657 RepID=UPI0030CAF954